MTHKTCGHCKKMIAVGDSYVAYGGMCWCSEPCLADHYMDPETFAGRNTGTISNKKIETIESKIEHRTLSSEDVQQNP